MTRNITAYRMALACVSLCRTIFMYSLCVHFSNASIFIVQTWEKCCPRRQGVGFEEPEGDFYIEVTSQHRSTILFVANE